jgi:large subunit ribosomal protein L4
MARAVKIKEINELGLAEPNLLHVQESYLRQVAQSHPKTACKKRKSDVRATSAKWYRQKGTGRARQGERTNPHLTGGGLAFAPKPRVPKKRLNKKVRRSALHSAVLLHVLNESAHVIQGKDFEELVKTKDVVQVISKITQSETILLVTDRNLPVWKASRNIWNVRLITSSSVNVRDLVESGRVVFTQSALDSFKQLLARQAGTQAGEADSQDAALTEGGDE